MILYIFAAEPFYQILPAMQHSGFCLTESKVLINLMRPLLVLVTLIFTVPLLAGENPRQEIARLKAVADSLHSVGRTDSALLLGARAIELAEKTADPTLMVSTHSSQGVFLRSSGNIEEALANYDAALAIVTSGQFRENPDAEAIEEIASLYINLAVLNLDMAHKEDAVRNAGLAADWCMKSTDPAFRSMLLGVVGSVMMSAGKFEDALHYQTISYDDAVEAGDQDAAFRSAAYNMLLADRMGDKAVAGRWRGICRELLPEIAAMTARLVYYQAECSICLKNGDNRGALEYFGKILALDGIDAFPFVQLDCYNNMHLSYASLGDYRQAYSTLLKSTELRDTIYAREKAESLRDLTVRYETKETELALALSETSRARTLAWLVALGAVLIIVIAGFMIYAARQRRRRLEREMEFASLRADIGRKLTEQYVEGLENERQRMARELHDGVCNDLLAIQMNMKRGISGEETTRLITACRDSVRRISHELMPPEFAYATLDEVIRYHIGKQMEASAGKTEIEYSSTGTDWNAVPDDMALEIYRIVQESIGNAVRHSGADRVTVSLDKHDRQLAVTVADNGRGVPSGPRVSGGLQSMRRRAAAVGAHLSMERSASGGWEIRLRVKIPS